MRTIGLVTVGRSDYSFYQPIIRLIQADAQLKLQLLVSGTHLSKKYGDTVRTIKKDQIPIAAKMNIHLEGDSPIDISQAMGRGIIGFAECFQKMSIDILLVLGDRFDMYSAVVAALPFKIPVAHIHGGELTQGVIDDALRHSITKLSHLHFVATEEYARRVIQLGEEPWRVVISGAPELDQLVEMQFLTRKDLESEFDVKLTPAPLLVTFHPVTLEYENTATYIRELLSALENTGIPIVFTAPNSDTGNEIIRNALTEFTQHHSYAYYVENFGSKAYFSMMSYAAALVGNSSSGIIEASSFRLPVVNIGTRQTGRIQSKNIIDTGYSSQDIFQGIQKACSSEFKNQLIRMKNPYRHGNASEIIVKKLKTIALDERLIKKTFYDLD